MVTEVVEVARANSPEPEERLWMTSPQSFTRSDLVFVDLVISGLDLDHDNLPLVFRAYLRGDVAIVDLVAEASQFLVGVTRASGHGSHVASIRHTYETAYSPSARIGNSSAWR
jgi:hypothetical protein